MKGKRNGNKFGIITMVIGILLMAISWYQFEVSGITDFLMSVNSDIFGIGGAFFIVGLVFTFWKVKIT